MENTVAVSDDMIQLIKELTVGAAHVDNLRPELTQLLLLSHAWSSSRFPIGYHPSLPALFCKAELIIIWFLWIGFVTNWQACFMDQVGNILVVWRMRHQEVAILEEEVICSCMVMRFDEAALTGDKYGTLAISAGYMFSQAMKWRERMACERKEEGTGVDL